MLKIGDKVSAKQNLINNVSHKSYNLAAVAGEITFIDHNLVEIDFQGSKIHLNYRGDYKELEKYIYLPMNNVNNEIVKMMEQLGYEFYSFEAVTVDGKVVKLSL